MYQKSSSSRSLEKDIKVLKRKKRLKGLLRKSKKVSDGHLIEIFATVKEPLNAKT